MRLLSFVLSLWLAWTGFADAQPSQMQFDGSIFAALFMKLAFAAPAKGLPSFSTASGCRRPQCQQVPLDRRSCSKHFGRRKDSQASACFEQGRQNDRATGEVPRNEARRIAANIAKLPGMLQH
jgi:hypothetical protein